MASTSLVCWKDLQKVTRNMSDVSSDCDRVIYQQIRNNFDEENEIVKRFYRRNLPFLSPYLISDLPEYIKRDIAVQLEDTGLFRGNGWRHIASLMGVRSNIEISRIACAARANQEQPLYLTLQSFLSGGRYVQIINCLLALDRIDILRSLQPYTRSLLNMEDD